MAIMGWMVTAMIVKVTAEVTDRTIPSVLSPLPPTSSASVNPINAPTSDSARTRETRSRPMTWTLTAINSG